MKTASDIINYITPEALMERLKVTRDAIERARRNERLPSLWYAACEDLAGRPLPRTAFTFKSMERDQ